MISVLRRRIALSSSFWGKSSATFHPFHDRGLHDGGKRGASMYSTPKGRVVTGKELLQEAVAGKGKSFSRLNNLSVLSDAFPDRDHYAGVHTKNEVMYLCPEQQLFVDEMKLEKIQGTSALELGLGSGVLSMSVAAAGAAQVTALEINPRAVNYAGFNIVLNGLEDKINIKTGDFDDLWAPIKGQQFDFIFSNPPFEPTPPGVTLQLNSDAGPLGMDFIDRMFDRLDEHLSPNGVAQVVTFALGNREGPFIMEDSIKLRLTEGAARLAVCAEHAPVTWWTDVLVHDGSSTQKEADALLNVFKEKGVTTLFCVNLHYEKGGQQDVQVVKTVKDYPDLWEEFGKDGVPAAPI